MAYKGVSKEYKEELLEIDQLVFKFQAGDKEAGEELMRRFGCHPKEGLKLYVGKYFKILRSPDALRFNDKDARKFVNCFIEDADIRKKMTKFYQTSDVKIIALKKLRDITDQVKRVPDDELKQELSLMFLEQAKRYKNISKNINFVGYLYNSYRYRVTTFITRRMRRYDPYEHMYTKNRLLHLQEDRYVDRGTEIQLEDKMFINQPFLQDDDELGNAWVRGVTCGPEFKSLTTLQRHIIKLYYEDDMTDGQIANKFGMHINTIHKNRKRAIKAIEQEKEWLFKEGYEA